jgi:hypothetical protein
VRDWGSFPAGGAHFQGRSTRCPLPANLPASRPTAARAADVSAPRGRRQAGKGADQPRGARECNATSENLALQSHIRAALVTLACGKARAAAPRRPHQPIREPRLAETRELKAPAVLTIRQSHAGGSARAHRSRCLHQPIRERRQRRDRRSPATWRRATSAGAHRPCAGRCVRRPTPSSASPSPPSTTKQADSVSSVGAAAGRHMRSAVARAMTSAPRTSSTGTVARIPVGRTLKMPSSESPASIGPSSLAGARAWVVRGGGARGLHGDLRGAVPAPDVEHAPASATVLAGNALTDPSVLRA